MFIEIITISGISSIIQLSYNTFVCILTSSNQIALRLKVQEVLWKKFK